MHEIKKLSDSYKDYDIEYNGETGKSHGVFLYGYPEIGQPELVYDTYSITGRDGELVGTEERRGNIKISCVFSILHQRFVPSVRELKNWLSGFGELVMSESTDAFYKVLKVEHKELERELRNYGRFSVEFLCNPFEYLKSGTREMEARDAKYNPYNLCHPTYLITGNGTCTLTVNGKSMKATVGQNLTIDTERMLAYRKDGTMMNTAVTGDYEDLYLQPGENDIKITSGFILKVIPNWRCL